jgi:ADP-ribose pyrophosphatase YjhB (NUDIX family)
MRFYGLLLELPCCIGYMTLLLTQVGAFGDPGRDPRGWCVSVAYAALVPSTSLGVKAAVRRVHSHINMRVLLQPDEVACIN